MKQWICAVLAVLLVIACSVPALAEDDSAVVTVNGDAIFQSELDTMIDSVSGRMSQYGIDGTDDSVLEIIRDSALHELVDDRLLTQDMTAHGCYDMSEEDDASITASAQAAMDTLLQQAERYFASYLDGAEDDGLSAEKLAETYMTSSGYTLEYMENYYRNAMASQKYEQWLMDGEPEIMQQDIQAGYEQRVESGKSAYGSDIAAFETALASGGEVWYRPDGYRAVLQIMLSASGEDDESRLASVKEKTDDIYARLDKGESFQSLIAEYGEDTAFDDEEFYRTGYQVHQDSILWEDAFIQAAFGQDMQSPGDYTQPVVFGDNVHILYYLKDVPGGAVALTDELSAALADDIYAEHVNAKMEARLAQLKESSAIVYAESED